TLARDLSRGDAVRILSAAQERAKPVRAQRLGYAGNDSLAAWAYYRYPCEWKPNGMRIPIIIEVWADPVDDDDEFFHVYINRTRIAVRTAAWVRKDGNSRTLHLQGCSMRTSVKIGRRSFWVAVNVETPYVQLTNDGKTPDLGGLSNLV